MIPNPFLALRIIFHKDTSVVLAISAIYYAVYYATQASIPGIFIDVYGFNELKVGLTYLSIGSGVVIGGFFNGKLMDRNYKITAKESNIVVDKVVGDDLTNFPIERARARLAWIFVVLMTALVVGYGWLLQTKSHVSGPLIFQFFIGFLVSCITQTFNTLIVDICVEQSSTAAAAGNITRCFLAAAAVAITQPMLDKIDKGWFFTFLGLGSAVPGFLSVWLVKRRAMRWRQARRARDNTISKPAVDLSSSSQVLQDSEKV